MKRFQNLTCLLALFTIMVTSCSKDDNTEIDNQVNIVGKWSFSELEGSVKHKGNPDHEWIDEIAKVMFEGLQMEFKADGKCILSSPEDDDEVAPYTIKDDMIEIDEHLSARLGFAGDIMTLTMSSEDFMSMTADDPELIDDFIVSDEIHIKFKKI